MISQERQFFHIVFSLNSTIDESVEDLKRSVVNARLRKGLRISSMDIHNAGQTSSLAFWKMIMTSTLKCNVS